MNTLFIDTSDNKEITIQFRRNSTVFEKKYQAKTVRSSHFVLPLIAELLIENGLTLKDIEAIEVNRGPGSFTGLRVGIAIANTLSFSLHVPINGKKIGSFVTPAYTVVY